MLQSLEVTVRSDSLAGEISKLAGGRILLTYAEHRGTPEGGFGDGGFVAAAMRALGS